MLCVSIKLLIHKKASLTDTYLRYYGVCLHQDSAQKPQIVLDSGIQSKKDRLKGDISIHECTVKEP